MSEKLTRIRLPRQRIWPGLMDWGELSASEMISLVRAHATHFREQAELLDAAADADFQIDVVRGSLVQKHIREVQASVTPQKDTPNEQ